MLIAADNVNLPVHQWIFDQMSDSVLFVNREGMIVAANDAAVELLQLEEKKNNYYDDYLDLNVISKPSSQEILIRTKRKPEKLILMRSIQIGENLCVMLREGGLQAAQETIKYSLNELLNGPYEGIIMHDRGKIVDCDIAFATMTGYERSELIGKRILSFIHPKDKRKVIKSIFDDLHTPYTVRGYRKDGSLIYVEFINDKVKHRNDEFTVAIVRNVTERVENEKQIEFMAYYDELTDLPNKNYFLKVLKDEINHSQSEKFAVHFIDLDYFKHINDTFGYHFGDKLLKVCADRLKNLLVDNVFVARMTGDEFLILQRNIQSEDDAKQYAKKIINIFKQPFNVYQNDIYTSISVGISIYPDMSKDPNELIKQADSAMYVIKNGTRNDFKVFRPAFTEGVKERLTLENELHKAILDKNFELYFQPQIDIKTNKIIGLEALCRWNHPERGIISPAQFIPIAEKTGLIVELGDWVLREACKQNKAWQDMGLPKINVSVNLSAKQFIQQDLVKQIKAILDETGLEPQYLELEITESMAMANERYIFDTLRDLQTLGVTVALDDFGTGYSSLKYLSEFPLSKLKIDRVFIQNRTEQNVAIVKTIIHLSHSLNLRVSAEGVEREEDLKFLNSENCDEVQGFYFSKPVPVKKVNHLFRKFA